VRFEAETVVVHAGAAADAFVCGHVDGARGAALERAVAHRGRDWAAGCLGVRLRLVPGARRRARPPAELRRAEAWLARRVRAFTATG
jgi:hypothetical protein